MPELKPYTLGYRRAEYLSPNGSNRLLEHDLVEAHQLRDTYDKRRIVVAQDLVLEGRHSRPRPDGGGLLVHLVQYGPGSHANIIPQSPRTDDAPVQMTPPPDDTDFMDGSLATLVSGNHVVFCAKGMRDSRFATYARRLFEEVGFPREAGQFELHKVADVDRLAVIHREGVRSVSLQASVFAASLQYLERREGKRGRGGLLDGMRRVFERGDGLQAAAEKENLRAIVELRFSKRQGGMLAQRTIQAIAEDMVSEDEPHFVIETLSGEKITPEQIVVRKRANVRQHGKSFDHEHAWHELGEFFNHLRGAGALEQ